jgi:ABC-type dipeptide/oligopeptide/nickel transport system ATPase component
VNAPILSVSGLSVSIRSDEGLRRVVENIGFDVHAGEVLALVGESGCGKTKSAQAIMGLLARESAVLESGSVELAGTDLSRLSEQEMRKVRGRDLSMVFQDPLTALDPVFTVGRQIRSLYTRHRGQGRAEARRSSRQLLQTMGFADAERIMDSYPHQLSGGMRQRIMLAMAMACEPRLIIADEPTSALDVTTQAQVLAQLTSLAREKGIAILLITHDLGVVAQYCDRALVMEKGRIIEQAPVDILFNSPGQEYTANLLAIAREGSL